MVFDSHPAIRVYTHYTRLAKKRKGQHR